MDTVLSKLKLYDNVIKRLEKYNDNIKQSFQMKYELTLEVDNLLKKAKNKIKTIKSTYEKKKKMSTLDIFKLIQELFDIDSALIEIWNMFDIDLFNAKTVMSHTHITGISEEYKAISTTFYALEKETKAHDEKIVHHYIMEISASSPQQVKELFMQYPGSIALYVHYIRNILDNNAENTEKYRYGLYMLECAKNHVMSQMVVEKLPLVKHKIGDKKSDKKQISGYTLHRFGLVPLYTGLLPSKVLHFTLNILSDEVKTIKQLSDLYKEKSIGLLVITNTTPTVVLYNIQNLYVRRFADPLITPPGTGITKNTLKRFNTIKSYKTENKVEKKIDKMGDTTSKKWIILRTFDSTHYDVMGFDKKYVFHDLFTIDKFTKPPSVRVDKYQRVFNTLIKKHIHEPKQITTMEQSRSFISITSLLQSELNTFFNKVLSVNPPSSVKDLSAIMTGKEITEIVMNILLKAYSISNLSQDKELLVSYLAQIEEISSKFIRTINEHAVKSGVKESTFTEKTKNALYEYLTNMFKSMVAEAVKINFDPTKDIFEKLTLKKKMLTTTF